ncbi:MAG: hypothetical protein R6V10_14630 [bacterium]
MQRQALAVLLLMMIFGFSCEWREPGNLCTELVRWELEPVSTVVLFYHLEGDFKEDVLKDLLSHSAEHESSRGFDQVRILALYDEDFLEELSSKEGKTRFYKGVLRLGPSVLSAPELSVHGGAFYSVDPAGENWQYLPKKSG